MKAQKGSPADDARMVRCLRAWLESHQDCSCDFPDFEEDGIIYSDPCSLRDYLGEPPLPKHAERFAALEAQTAQRPR